MRLLDNPFSPFARKVRLVLDWKGLSYEAIDGLDKANRRVLEAANGRVEVPALIDGDVTVVNSSDIVAYLEHTHPEPPVYPANPAARVRGRAWERCADTAIDPILADISYWSWAERPDQMPAGMKEVAQKDLESTMRSSATSKVRSSSAATSRSPISRCSRISPPSARSASRSRRSSIPGCPPG